MHIDWRLLLCLPACWTASLRSPRWSRRCSTLWPWWRGSSFGCWTTAPWWVRTAATTAWAAPSTCWYVSTPGLNRFRLPTYKLLHIKRFSNRATCPACATSRKTCQRQSWCVLFSLPFFFLWQFHISCPFPRHISSVLNAVCVPRICNYRHGSFRFMYHTL